MPSLLERFPLRLIIRGEDVSFDLDEGFTFSNIDPGGYEAASFPLPYDKPQIMRGDPVRLECGLQTAWEGRVKEVQRSLGAKTLVQCEGYGASLRENLLAEIFVDRDLTKWTGPTVARQINLVANQFKPNSASLGVEPVAAGNPSIVEELVGTWPATARGYSQGVYDSEGIPLGKIYYTFTKGAGIGEFDEHWAWEAQLLDGLIIGEANDTTGNLRAGSGSGTLTSAATSRVYASISLYKNNAEEATGPFVVYWHNLAVYGRHGLAGRGANPVGYYPSDIAQWVVEKCPGVKVGVIETASQYTAPHAAYLSPTPIEQILSDMGKLACWHWGVWESQTYLAGNQEPRVDFRSRPAEGAPTAWIWRSGCDNLDIRESIENLYDSARVTYTEPGGVERSLEVSLSNPALEEAALHRQVNLSLGAGTKKSAEDWGLLQLRLLADQARMTGSASLVEPARTMSGVEMAPWLLKAGLDRLRIPDLPCSDVWGERNDLPITRVECSGSGSGITTNVEFGLGGNLIETLAAQLQANLTAAG